MESKYTPLSIAFRAAIPLSVVSIAINEGLGLVNNKFLKFQVFVLKDNIGHKHNPFQKPEGTLRDKFYALQMNWSRSWLEPNKIKRSYIARPKIKRQII